MPHHDPDPVVLIGAAFIAVMLAYVFPAALQLNDYMTDPGITPMVDSMRRMGFLPR